MTQLGRWAVRPHPGPVKRGGGQRGWVSELSWDRRRALSNQKQPCQRRHSHGGLGGPGSEIAGPRWPHRSQADKSQSSLPAPQRDPLSAGTRGRCWSLPGLIRLQCRPGQRASQGREAGSAPDTPAGPQLRGLVAQGPTHARTHARSPERSEAAGPAALDRKALGGGQSQRLLSSSFGARERFSNK